MYSSFKFIAVPFFLGLSACGASNFNSPPALSSIDVSSEAMPETKSIRVPVPDPEVEEPKMRADGTSLWQGSNDGFFKDQRAKRVGDVLTVNIEISDKASLSSEIETDRSSANSVEFPTIFGYQNKLAKVLPGISADDLPDSNNVVDLGAERSLSGSGSVDRNEKISLKIAAMVIETLPNGSLVIAGRQEIRVNQELRELRVVGIVRQQDISNENTISYEKIAEARVSYGGRGLVSDVQKPAYGKRALDIILPY
jgi:flagellar L-ring protein precursor FlgH